VGFAGSGAVGMVDLNAGVLLRPSVHLTTHLDIRPTLEPQKFLVATLKRREKKSVTGKID